MTSGATDDGAVADATTSTQLGPDWVVGADGVPFRRGARVILLDQDDRVLLARGHDMDRPDRTWWFTVGGGIDAGESAREAAARELQEETGLVVPTEELVGPVLRRRAVFDFWRRTVRQDEEFFLARVDRPGAVSAAGWTAVERAFMDEVRWWTLDDLALVREEVFPSGLVDVVRGLLPGWDGSVQVLPDGS